MVDRPAATTSPNCAGALIPNPPPHRVDRAKMVITRCILSLRLSMRIKLKVVEMVFTKRKVDVLTIAVNHDNEECICWIPGNFRCRAHRGNTTRSGRSHEADRARRTPGAQGRSHPRRPRRVRGRLPQSTSPKRPATEESRRSGFEGGVTILI